MPAIEVGSTYFNRESDERELMVEVVDIRIVALTPTFVSPLVMVRVKRTYLNADGTTTLPKKGTVNVRCDEFIRQITSGTWYAGVNREV